MILRSSFRKRWHRLHGKVSTLLSWNRWTRWGCGTSTKSSDNIILSKFVMASASDEQLFYWVWWSSAEPFQQKLDKSFAIAMVTLAHCLLQQMKPSKAQSCPCCELLQRCLGVNGLKFSSESVSQAALAKQPTTKNGYQMQGKNICLRRDLNQASLDNPHSIDAKSLGPKTPSFKSSLEFDCNGGFDKLLANKFKLGSSYLPNLPNPERWSPNQI